MGVASAVRSASFIFILVVHFQRSEVNGFDWNHRMGITTEGVSEFHQEAAEKIMTEKIAVKFLEDQMVQEYRDKCHRGVFSLFLGTHVPKHDLTNCTFDDDHIQVSLTHDTELPFGAYAVVKRIRVRHFQMANEGKCILSGVLPEFYVFMAQMMGWDKLLPLPETTFARFPLINQGYVYNPDKHTKELNQCIILLMKDESSHQQIRERCPFQCHTEPVHGEL